MNRILLALVVAAPLAAACAAPAKSTSASPSSPPLASAAEKPQKTVCRSERPLGSNIARVVCRTQDQMDAERQAAQDAIHAGPKTGPSQQQQ